MTTENQIQVNLQKFKSKKQDLGAIEDAVNQVKNNLLENLATVEANTEGLNNITLRIQKLIMDTISEYDSSFNNVNENLIDSIVDDMEELDGYGVEVGDARGIIDAWREANGYANDIYYGLQTLDN